MTKKKILCTIISVLLLGTSICSVFAADTTANLGTATEPAAVGYMERISAPANFDFEIISTGRDSVVAEFTAAGRITNPPYVGEKGTKNTAEKVTNLQYVLEYDKEYSFVYTVIEDDIETVYNSFLTVERGSSVEVIFNDIIKNVIIEDEQRSAGGALEIEPNNSLYSATQTYDDYDNRGAITSTSDVDWWKVSFMQAGRANFWLGNIPAGCDYDISVFNAAGVEIGYSCNNAQEQELVQLDVTPDTYYIKIETYSGVSSSKYLFRVKNYPPTPEPEEPAPGEVVVTFVLYDMFTGLYNGPATIEYRGNYDNGSSTTRQITGLSGQPIGINIRVPGYHTYVFNTTKTYTIDTTEEIHLRPIGSTVTNANFTSPVGWWYITSHFGWRSWKTADYYTMYDNFDNHYGLDLAGTEGVSPVYSVCDISVDEYTFDSDESRGNYIIINDNESSKIITYMHMFDNSCAESISSPIPKGEQIGIIGNTGYSTGAHLHIEIYDIQNQSLIDPELLFN